MRLDTYNSTQNSGIQIEVGSFEQAANQANGLILMS